jgi:hypothetical protein
MELTFTAKMRIWPGEAAWCFISLPGEYYEEIRMITSGPKRGFGSVRVEATIGKTIWKTSIFPDSKLKSYLLPIKKAVRKAENIEVGDMVEVKIRLYEV